MTDTALAFNNGFEFTDGVHEAIEWEYDENGNLTKDLNKNITAIQYNCLGNYIQSYSLTLVKI